MNEKSRTSPALRHPILAPALACLGLHHGRRRPADSSDRPCKAAWSACGRHGGYPPPCRTCCTRAARGCFARVLRWGRTFHGDSLYVLAAQQDQSENPLLLALLVHARRLSALLWLELAVLLTVTKHLIGCQVEAAHITALQVKDARFRQMSAQQPCLSIGSRLRLSAGDPKSGVVPHTIVVSKRLRLHVDSLSVLCPPCINVLKSFNTRYNEAERGLAQDRQTACTQQPCRTTYVQGM